MDDSDGKYASKTKLILGIMFKILDLACYKGPELPDFPRAIFQVQAPGALIFGGAINGGFLRYQFGGLIHGAAYFWNFTVF